MIVEDFTIQAAQLPFFLSLGAATIGFLCYHFLSHSSWVEEAAPLKSISRQRFLGFFFLGLLPLGLMLALSGMGWQDLGLGYKGLGKSVLYGLALGSPMVVVNLFNARNKEHLEVYPQLRAPRWTGKMAVINFGTWALYLLGYEILFRGVLFFGVKEVFGLAVSMAINVSLYSLTHIPKGWKEAVGAIPMGLFMCWLTAETGTIWAALIVHIVMAWSNEGFSLKYHPEMQLIWRWKEK